MSEPSSPDMDAFTFGDDGYFYDPLGQPCVLMGAVEFSKFWHHLDACFESPLGRKLIYAATDAEERVISKHPNLQFGRWFGKAKVLRRLQKRAREMGWGRFVEDHISAPVHDGLTVGFSLAHHEHLHQQRATMEWHQISADAIRLTFAKKEDPMVPAPVPQRLPWFGSEHPGSLTGAIELNLDVRANVFFNGEERSFFLSNHVFFHLFESLFGRPMAKESSRSFRLDLEASYEHGDVLASVIFAASSSFLSSDRPIYVQTPSDWAGHFSARLTQRGFGTVRVEQSILENHDRSVFIVKSPVAPLAIGQLIGMWQRAHGTIGDVRVEPADDGVRVSLGLRRVEYP